MSMDVLEARARLGVAAKAKDWEAMDVARRDMEAAKALRAVQDSMTASPMPFTDEQRGEIIAVLTGAA